MQHPQINQINYYWANRLDCSPDVFDHSGAIVLPCKQPLDYSRIVITRTCRQSIVQVPLEIVKLVTDKLDMAQVVTAEDIILVLADKEIKFGWRDFIWYFPSQLKLPPLDGRIRQLLNSDRSAIDDLMTACTKEERELGNVSLAQKLPLGLFDNSNLLAVAAFIFDGDAIADIGVITHPDHRGKGLGKSIVLALVRHGIEQRRIVQYTTQEQNVGSKRLAESIGFWLYAVEEGLYLE